MKILFTIAWRNLWRNPRRTLLTALTVSLGLALLLIFLGLNDGAHEQMVEGAVRMGSGHVLVQAEGYQELGGVERTLSAQQAEEFRDWLERARDERMPVEAVASRVFGSGLASSADGSAGVRIIGVQPEVERRASRFPEKIVAGEFLEPEDENRVVLGTGVARKLELEVGDKLVLMAQGAGSDDIQSLLVRVEGILETGQDEFDQTLLLTPLKTAQDFFLLGDRVHQVAVVMESDRHSRELSREGKALLPRAEVLHWTEAMPELVEFIRVDDGGNYVFNAFLFLLIGFMVLNTLLMSVLERRREFTLLDALGLPPARRFAMVILEASFIASISAVAGFALGYSLHLLLETYGLSLEWFQIEDLTAAGVAFDPVLYSSLSAERIAQSIFWVFAMTLFLALFPAVRAARSVNVALLGRD